MPHIIQPGSQTSNKIIYPNNGTIDTTQAASFGWDTDFSYQGSNASRRLSAMSWPVLLPSMQYEFPTLHVSVHTTFNKTKQILIVLTHDKFINSDRDINRAVGLYLSPCKHSDKMGKVNKFCKNNYR